LLLAALAGSTLVGVPGCTHGPATVQAELGEARRLSADLRVQFSRAADASNRAVMADTDEASVTFAREAEQTLTTVEHDVAALSALTRNLGVSDEVEILERFQKQFADYRSVDKKVLALAVENTNLKAQHLSFGPAREAADRFKAALVPLPSSLPAKDRCRAEELVASAVLNVRELQILQGPHIASADDAAMTGMEKEMTTLEAQTGEALAGLHALGAPSAMTAADAAFVQFKGVEGQIVALSRRNTNVRSLELALKDKPPLTAACDDSLLRLQTALAQEGSKATR
jgi:hypothetical protein